MNSTVRALLQRGLSSELARTLHWKGLTLDKLSQMSKNALVQLGIPDSSADSLRGRRPPIKDDVLYELLYRNKSICCICQDKSRGIVVHHIISWAESHSHEIENLAVLCPVCHDKAHTKKELTREFSPKYLKYQKKKWEKEVRNARTTSLFITNPLSFLGPTWDYFHRQRLLDCAIHLNLDIEKLPGFACLSQDLPEYRTWRYRWEGRVRAGFESEYNFFNSLIRKMFDLRDWVDLDSIWSRREIQTMAKSNSLVSLTACHRFKKIKAGNGPGQLSTGYYNRKGLRLEFTFDPWECTSNSAYTAHLAGSWVCTSIGLVRNVGIIDDRLTISTTCLAIGTGFTEYCGKIPDVAYTHGNAGTTITGPE